MSKARSPRAVVSSTMGMRLLRGASWEGGWKPGEWKLRLSAEAAVARPSRGSIRTPNIGRALLGGEDGRRRALTIMAKALADLEALLREIPSAAAERPLAALNQLDSNAVGTSSGTDVASGAETTEELRARSLSRRSTEWQPSPLTGLPIEALVEVVVAPLIRMAHAGRLSALDARRLTSGDILDECEVLGEIGLEFRDPLMRVLRHVWTRDVAWALFTTEWVDSVVRLLHRIVHGPAGEAQHAPRKAIRVVEVAAGSGLLATAMRAKGIDWSSSDSAKVVSQ